MEFGERLKVLRNDKELTQAQVASLAGISRRTYVSYEKSEKRPRKRETYARLASVLGCDINDLLVEDTAGGLAPNRPYQDLATLIWAGVGMGMLASELPFVVGLPLAALAGVPLGTLFQGRTKTREEMATPISSTNEALVQSMRDHKRFVATSKGLIYTMLSEKGVRFSSASTDVHEKGSSPEEAIAIESADVDAWWFYFEEGKALRDEPDAMSVDTFAKLLMARLYDYVPDKRRKVSIVVGTQELFDALAARKGHNCYRGNMSAIFVDSEEVRVAGEACIATYDLTDDASLPMRIANEVGR